MDKENSSPETAENTAITEERQKKSPVSNQQSLVYLLKNSQAGSARKVGGTGYSRREDAVPNHHARADENHDKKGGVQVLVLLEPHLDTSLVGRLGVALQLVRGELLVRNLPVGQEAHIGVPAN